MPNLFAWLFRGAERDRAYARYNALRERYADQGGRIIKLSARTDLLRKSAGSTLAAFAYVENAFATATQEYARIGALLEALGGGLEKGKVGDFVGAESAVSKLTPAFDELERRLTDWEARWQEVPRRIGEAAQALAELKAQVAPAETTAGGPLPVSAKLGHMQAHLERIQATLQEGNPVEAGHMIEDLAMARRKLQDEAGGYVSGAGAIAQAEAELAELKAKAPDLAAAPAEAAAALAAAESLLPRLRAALAAGDLDKLQQELLTLQTQLSTARASL